MKYYCFALFIVILLSGRLVSEFKQVSKDTVSRLTNKSQEIAEKVQKDVENVKPIAEKNSK